MINILIMRLLAIKWNIVKAIIIYSRIIMLPKHLALILDTLATIINICTLIILIIIITVIQTLKNQKKYNTAKQLNASYKNLKSQSIINCQ